MNAICWPSCRLAGGVIRCLLSILGLTLCNKCAVAAHFPDFSCPCSQGSACNWGQHSVDQQIGFDPGPANRVLITSLWSVQPLFRDCTVCMQAGTYQLANHFLTGQRKAAFTSPYPLHYPTHHSAHEFSLYRSSQSCITFSAVPY